MVNCLSANAAIALADNLVDEDTRSSWEGHLAQCGLCRELLAALVDDERPKISPPPARGEQIGRYIVKERIGSGGFGLVYRAEDPKLGRDVALKIWRVDPLAGGSEGAQYLLQEARSLAKLSHPNVMAIYDSGRDGERVFLAGELIEGTPLSEHIGEHDGEQIAVWMRQCASGLAAAHEVGLIHRDIKPDNIIVGSDGHARLVDFGLATSNRHSTQMPIPIGVVDAEASTVMPSLKETMTVGAQAGTPAYMAPEQLCGRMAGKKSDQYSLCATFYEVANSRRVSSGESFQALREFVLEKHPPKFRKGLPPRLVSVLQRGLLLAPEERWDNVSELYEKLHLPGNGRGRWTLAIAGICVAALAFLLIRGEKENVRDCEISAKAIDSVWSAERKLGVQSAFDSLGKGGEYSKEAFALVDTALSAYVVNWRSQRVATCEATYHEQRISVPMFDRQMLCLDRRLREVDSLATLLAKADQALFERAPRAITQLVDLTICSDRERLGLLQPLPTTAEELAKVREVEDLVAKAESLRMVGLYEEATSAAEVAVKNAESLSYAPTIAEASFELGFISSYRNDVDNARKHLSDAHFKAVAANDLRTSARAAIELVYVYGISMRELARAEEWIRHAQSAIDAGGKSKYLEANLESNLGQLALNRADSKAALQHNQRALDLKTELYGLEDRSAAQSLNNLGLAYELAGNNEEAIRKFQDAHRIFSAALGPHHPYVGTTATNIGNQLNAREQYAEAQVWYEEALEIAVDQAGPESYTGIRARLNIAISLQEQGRNEEAADKLAELAISSEKHLVEGFDTQALIANSSGVCATDAGNHEEALFFFGKARALRRKFEEEDNPNILLLDVNLAQTEGKLGRTKEAMARLDGLIPRFQRVHGMEHPMTAWALITRADQYLIDGDTKGALGDLRAAEPILAQTSLGPQRQFQFNVLMGKALWASGDPKGVVLVQKAIDTYRPLAELGDKATIEIAVEWLQKRQKFLE